MKFPTEKLIHHNARSRKKLPRPNGGPAYVFGRKEETLGRKKAKFVADDRNWG